MNIREEHKNENYRIVEQPHVEGEFVREDDAYNEWYNYLRVPLNELENGDTYEGKPILLPVEKVQFELDEKPKYRTRLLLVDPDSEEYLQISINLKEPGEIQTNVHNASALYALVGGIQDLHVPEWTAEYNRIKRVDIEEWQEYLDTKDNMKIKVVEKQGNGFNYNSFKVMGLQ